MRLRMKRKLSVESLSIACVACFMAMLASPASAARFCKDGLVTYSGSAPSQTRAAAEASALRAWQAVKGQRAQASRSPVIRPQCVRSSDALWRCFVRAGPCKIV